MIILLVVRTTKVMLSPDQEKDKNDVGDPEKMVMKKGAN